MNKEIRVGIMVALSLGILAAAIFNVGSFRDTLEYHIRFVQVNGLQVDSPVHFNGVPIGRVTEIRLEQGEGDDGKVNVIVTISVHKSLGNHIRTSTIAAIKVLGVLGDKYILLVNQDNSAPLLEEESFIQTAERALDVDALLKQGQGLVDDVSVMSENLRTLIAQLATADGVVQRMIGDPELARKLTGVLMQVLDRIQTRESLMGLMLNDPEFGRAVHTNLEHATARLNRLLRDLEDNDNLFQLVARDPEFKHAFKDELFCLFDEASTFLASLSQARGLAHKLVQDEEWGERVSQNIEKASYHLASILEKIDEGDGSAALFLNDPSVYQGVYEVVYGMQHSGITKWYIQKKRKKGHKLLGEKRENE